MGVEILGVFNVYPFAALAKTHSPLGDRIGDTHVGADFRFRVTVRKHPYPGRQEAPALNAFWFACYAFHPDTLTFRAERTGAVPERGMGTASPRRHSPPGRGQSLALFACSKFAPVPMSNPSGGDEWVCERQSRSDPDPATCPRAPQRFVYNRPLAAEAALES